MKIKITLILICILALHTFSNAQTPGPTYCGPYTSSEPVSIGGVTDTIISDLEISNPNGHCIRLSNCHDVTIQRCLLGASTGNGISLENCTNISITDCRMFSVATGVYAMHCQGISVTYIGVKNVLGPFPRGQMVQFNGVNGSGNRINYNVVENILGESNPEDAINIFNSNGAATDPIRIIGNWIRGGGPSASGGGILASDFAGSNVIVADNILVDPGQYGIGIATGTDIEILNNKIYAKQQSFTNIGLVVWNPYEDECGENTVMGNEVNYTNRDGVLNSHWTHKCGTVEGWSDNDWNADIDASILPEQILPDCTGTSANEITALPDEFVEIYPNPFHSTITVELKAKIIHQNNLTFRLYDIFGREVRNEVIDASKKEIQLNTIPGGLYFYEIKNDKQILSKGKIVKM